MRRFGVVAFRHVEDAVKVVAASPHAIGNAPVHSAYNRQSRNDQANKSCTGKDVHSTSCQRHGGGFGT